MGCDGLVLALAFLASFAVQHHFRSALYDLYEIRQILLPPSSDISSEPSGSWSNPTGRPQTSRFSGASMNPFKKSFGPL